MFEQISSGLNLVGITVQPRTSESNIAGRSGFTMNVVSLINRKIGFKVRTNKPVYYVVKPNGGLLSAKRSIQVVVTVSPYVNRQVIQDDPDQHSFMFIGILWTTPTFNNNLFETVEASSRAEKQTVTLTEIYDSRLRVGGAMRPMYGTNMLSLGYGTETGPRPGSRYRPGTGYGTKPGGMGLVPAYGTGLRGFEPGAVFGTNKGGVIRAPIYEPNMGGGGAIYGGNMRTECGGVMPGYAQNIYPIYAYGNNQNIEHNEHEPMVAVEEIHVKDGDNNNLMNVYPVNLCFTPPYGHGAPKQNHEVKVISKSSEAIAFKVLGNTALYKYYTVSPREGVILPSSRAVIDFQMKDTFTHQTLINCTEEQYFTITCMEWPTNLTIFDDGMWADLEQVHAQKQSTIVNIELDKPVQENGGENTGEAEEALAIGEGPELVEVHPDVIAFIPPFGKGKQSTFVTVTSRCPQKVAFKVHTNKVQFYFVQPNKGIILPFKTIDIGFEMNEKFTLDEVKSNPKPHVIQIQLVKWNAAQFETETFDKLSKNKDATQTFNFDINIPGAVFHHQSHHRHDKRHKKTNGKEEDERHNKKKKKDREHEDEEDDEEVGGECQKKEKKLSHKEKNSKFTKKEKGSNTNLVDVVPMVLSYKPPFGKNTQHSSVTIKNTSSEVIAYKIQTNKPTIYLVKPGRGLLLPGKDVKINFQLKATFTDKDLKHASRHKFDVMALPWPKEQEYNNDLWKNFEANKKEELQTVTLTVNFG